MKTLAVLLYLLGLNLMDEMADGALDKPDATEDQRLPFFTSDDQDEEEDRAASTPSTSVSEIRDDDGIIALGPFSPSCRQFIGGRKPMHIPLGKSPSPPKSELSVMSFTRQCSVFGDYSDSHLPDSSVAPMNVPVNLNFSSDLYNHLKSSHRRTRSSGYYNDVLLRYAAGFGQGKIIVPFGKRVNGYTQGLDDKAMRKLLKSPWVIHLNGLGETRPLDEGDTEEQGELTRCPSLLGEASLQKPRLGGGGGHHSMNRRSVSRMSDMTHLSCSSSLSTCSYESVSTQHGIISQAVLRCMWSKGTPYFVYTMADDLDEVYVASRWKVKSLDNKALDHIYLFYARTGPKAATHAKVSPYRLVGKMKVSSCVMFVSSTSSVKETEFVFFSTAQHDYGGQLSPSKPGVVKNHGFSKNLFNVLRASNPRPQNSVSRRRDSSSPGFEDPMKESFVDELDHFLTDPANLSKLQPRNEMAAVVVRSHQSDSDREMASGGWGLKFLEKQKDANRDSSPKKHTTVNVLIPAGHHGGTQSGSVGPSSLIERWKTGGRCDCGGWDLGCPLTVLCDRSTDGNILFEEPPLETCKTVNLFVEGSKQGEPVLRIVDVQEGLYVVYSQANISVLQSFSIAVSMVHSQIPALCPS